MDAADYGLTSAGVLSQAGATSRIGFSSGGAVSANAFYVYALPNLQGQTLTNAHNNVVASGKSGGTAFNGDLYALTIQANIGAANVPQRYYEAPATRQRPLFKTTC